MLHSFTCTNILYFTCCVVFNSFFFTVFRVFVYIVLSVCSFIMSQLYRIYLHLFIQYCNTHNDSRLLHHPLDSTFFRNWCLQWNVIHFNSLFLTQFWYSGLNQLQLLKIVIQNTYFRLKWQSWSGDHDLLSVTLTPWCHITPLSGSANWRKYSKATESFMSGVTFGHFVGTMNHIASTGQSASLETDALWEKHV